MHDMPETLESQMTRARPKGEPLEFRAPGVKSHTSLRPKGHVIVTSPDHATFEADCLQCSHCGRQWIIEPGSGRKRGWCFKCGSVTCGAPGCIECLPAEKRLDLYEKGQLLRL